MAGAMRVVSVVLGLGLVALAGCAEGGGSAQTEEYEFEDVEVQADRGIIRGVVFDASITPVEGATVEVLNTEKSATTNADGAFLVADLEPGSYFLKVAKRGFETVQASAEVEGGVKAPPIVKVQLQKIPGSDPHFIAHSYTGYIGCSWKLVNFVGGCNFLSLFGQEDSTIFIPLAAPPTYYQNELLWESTQALGDGMVTIQWACAEGGSCSANSVDHRTCNVRGPSPLVCRVHGDEGGGNSNYVGINGTRLGQEDRGLYIRGYAHCAVCATDVVGVGLMLEQTFHEYTFFFYNFKPPEEWLFVEDGEPVVPQ